MNNEMYQYSKHNATDYFSDSIFQWLPICGIIIDLKGNIVAMNGDAKKFLGISATNEQSELRHINSVFVEISQINDLRIDLKQNEGVIVKKFLFRKFDKSIACVDVYVRLFGKSSETILLLFSESLLPNQFIFAEMMQAFRHEVMQLKPYLNKPGKELLQKIISDNKLEGVIKNSPIKKAPVEIVTKKRIASIAELFPELTNNELVFCGLLSMRLTMVEIAQITGKTANSLRVNFHRILRKSNLPKGKDLIRKLEAIEV